MSWSDLKKGEYQFRPANILLLSLARIGRTYLVTMSLPILFANVLLIMNLVTSAAG